MTATGQVPQTVLDGDSVMTLRVYGLLPLFSKHQVLDRSLRDLHRKIEETATLPGVNRQAVSLRLGILDSH
jgi:hypothetical protein